jgi:hypothetical protein
VNGGHEQIARIPSAGRDDDRPSTIPEQVRAVCSIAFARERQARRKGGVVEGAMVVFEQDERFEALHPGTAVTQQQVDVAIVVESH